MKKILLKVYTWNSSMRKPVKCKMVYSKNFYKKFVLRIIYITGFEESNPKEITHTLFQQLILWWLSLNFELMLSFLLDYENFRSHFYCNPK